MTRSRLLVGAVVALAVTQGACVATTVVGRPDQLHAVQDRPERLMVQLRGDPAWLSVIQYRTTPDSLLGSIEGSSAPGTPLRRLEVSFDSVATIRLQRKDGLRTAAIPVLAGVVVAMTAWILVSP